MKLFIHTIVKSTVAAVLVLVGTGMAHADKGGSGGNRGGSSGGSAKMGSGNGGGMKVNQGGSQQVFKAGNSNSNINVNKNKVVSNVNKTNVVQNQQNSIKKTGPISGNSNVAKNTGIYNSNKMPQQNFKKDFFCGTTGNKGCYPNWNYCGYGFGCWNSCWSFPWYRNYCYTPCYDYCSYPLYSYCSTPTFYTYQPEVVVTTKVIEVVQQPAPVVETVTTQTTATATAIKPPAHDVSFLTGSVTGK